MKLRLLFSLALAFSTTPAAEPLPPDHAERMAHGLEMFAKDVRGLLVEHCVKCHGGEKTKADFDITTREGLLKGGADGAALVLYKSAESPMIRQMRHEEDPHMPDKKPRLPDEVIAKVAAWIDNGAPYDKPLIEGKKPPRDRAVVTAEDRQWWSFQPLAKIEPPAGQGNVVDRFLAAKAAAKGLALAPAADPRTLIRRMYLDLTGLPPSPEEVEAFVTATHSPITDHPSPAAAAAVDRLLASPRYGERWARHWLDVARFAESSGFEQDYDRAGAFYFRDFTIKALNADMPYDQFVRWQLAGDEFEPENPLALSATGFLGAGVFPTQITANEVERTRYDALDDMLSTTGSAFLGLNVGCARCHDHKYDPIPTADYYRMLSIFTTTVRSVIELDMEPEKTREAVAKWDAEHAPLAAALAKHEDALRPKFDAWLADGAKAAQAATWNVLALDDVKSKAGTTFKKMDDGSVLAEGANGDSDEYTITAKTTLRRLTGLRLDALADPSMVGGGPGRAGNGNIGLSRIQVFAAPVGGGEPHEIKLAKAVADFEQNNTSLSIASALDDNPATGWAVDPQFGKDHTAVFTFAEPVDFPGGAVLTVRLDFRLNTKHNIGRPRLAVIADAEPTLKADALPAAVAEALQHRDAMTAEQRGAVFDWWKRRDAAWHKLTAQLDEHAKKKPTGKTEVLVCAEGNKPVRMHTQGADFFEQTYFLKRGSTDQKDGVAPAGFLQVLSRAPDAEKHWQWAPPAGAKYSGRRRALANWITDTEQGAGALAARVIVNRVWQHHFGRGLVATPNDFGKTGAPCAQPELLDWLAGEFIRGGWQLKPLHKLIMSSAAYAQSSAPDRAKETADPDNALFVRRTPQRLEGEAIRDSLLAVSGVLDATMFGPGTKDERSKRRSIYFTIKRSQLIGSMVAFDAPEPLASQGSRPTTTVAPQALMLMNAPQVREWAEAFAKRIEGDAPIARAYAFALGRPPTAGEAQDAAAFLAAQTQSYTAENKPQPASLALADFCQVVFGLNEFIYAP